MSVAHSPPFPAMKVPPLEAGDRLTRAEFDRRYNSMPDLKKAELIEKIVYMGSPVRFVQHGKPHMTVSVLDQAVNWFVLKGDQYIEIALDQNGILKSKTFPGLWLPTQDLLASNLPAMFTLLDTGVQSAEHAAFRRRLAKVSP